MLFYFPTLCFFPFPPPAVNVSVRQLCSEEKRLQLFSTVTIVYLIEAKMPPAWLHPHPQMQSRTTSGGVTREECGLALDQTTQRERREDGQNHRRTAVSAGLPTSQTLRLTVCHVPLGRMLGPEREGSVKRIQTARLKIETPSWRKRFRPCPKTVDSPAPSRGGDAAPG